MNRIRASRRLSFNADGMTSTRRYSDGWVGKLIDGLDGYRILIAESEIGKSVEIIPLQGDVYYPKIKIGRTTYIAVLGEDYFYGRIKLLKEEEKDERQPNNPDLGLGGSRLIVGEDGIIYDSNGNAFPQSGTTITQTKPDHWGPRTPNSDVTLGGKLLVDNKDNAGGNSGNGDGNAEGTNMLLYVGIGIASLVLFYFILK